MPNLSHVQEDKYEISIYLSWDQQDFIILAKKRIQNMRYIIQNMIYIFFLFLEENVLWVSSEVPHQHF